MEKLWAIRRTKDGYEVLRDGERWVHVLYLEMAQAIIAREGNQACEVAGCDLTPVGTYEPGYCIAHTATRCIPRKIRAHVIREQVKLAALREIAAAS